MLKKILHIFRFSLIGCVWTYTFLMLANYLTFSLWNFNFMSSHSWKVIDTFWNSGGVIKSGSDYLFLSFLISLPLIWIFGWKYFLKVNYINIIFVHLKIYCSWMRTNINQIEYQKLLFKKSNNIRKTAVFSLMLLNIA